MAASTEKLLTPGQQQKVLAITYDGGPYTLIRHAVPTPSAGTLLVRVEGAGLNPGASKLQKGPTEARAFLGGVYPFFTGTEGAGTVVRVGADVMDFSVGDRVLFQGWLDAEHTSWQEYTLVDATLTAKIPETMSPLVAAAIPMGLATAAFGLAQPFPTELGQAGGAGLTPFWEPAARGRYAGQPLLVLGGGSIVGQHAIQIAKHLGFSPIITTASLKHTTHLQSLGATHVIDRNLETGPALNALRRELGKDIEIGLIYDAVHEPITQEEVDLLAPGGTLVSINPPFAFPKELQYADGRRATASIGVPQLDRARGSAMYKRLGELLRDRILESPRIEKLEGGLAGIAEGLERLYRNEVSGIKLVVNPTETADF
ncbi:chaperonin 10-like protein [Mycena capillaripes]|nr:chaperonin 10-like protein [Mycena capillaripes]